MMDTSTFLEENEVTPENIASLFRQAFYNASVDEDEDVVIYTENLALFISINSNLKLLQYTALYEFKDFAQTSEKHSFVNSVNDEYVLVRFAADEDTLCADYFLPYEGGISPLQIVSSLRLFSKIVPIAINSSDDDGLVK